ncbi:hypothetical protein KJ991_01775 [Patescibacteria group bacterium]|nr:hypothetical protein [Patescibacteria group bacterium]MBU4057365.1 hypothetical protein [Patescibacteria group bacterium]MBU4115597.1 hypothetical protein [Patescibacteria group bacterium]
MSWSERKKTKYVIIGFLIIILLLVIFVIDFKSPTCTDGKQNQDEQGIDCGGRCENICKFSAEELVIKWSRFFIVKEGIYNALAYVENPNINLETKGMSYIFKLYDENGILVYERKGITNIPAQRIIPIFEETIQTGNRIPKRTTFEFTSLPVWKKTQQDLSAQADKTKLNTKNISIKNERGFTKLEAVLENPTLSQIQDIKVISILFDIEGNAVNSSRTVVDFIKKDSSEKIVFTWPYEFADSIAKIEIIPLDYSILK